MDYENGRGNLAQRGHPGQRLLIDVQPSRPQSPAAPVGGNDHRHLIANLTRQPVYYSYRIIDLYRRMSCARPREYFRLNPLTTHMTVTVMSIGDCPPQQVLRELRDFSNVPELSVRQRRGAAPPPLTEPLTLSYKYYLEAWECEPNPQNCWRPDQTFSLEGRMIVPTGTPSQFCVHYTTTAYL